MYRQGDLLFKKIGALPEKKTLVPDGVILRGEATGHAHHLEGGRVYRADGLLYLAIAKQGKVIHDEHKPVVLSRGHWAVIRQREYQSKDMTKLVVD